MDNLHDLARAAPQLREALQARASESPPRRLTRGECGALVGRLNRVLGGDLARRLVLGYLFGGQAQAALSTKSLTPAQWWALWEWVGFAPGDEPGEWLTDPRFPREALLVFSAALRGGGPVPPALGLTAQAARLGHGGEVTDIQADLDVWERAGDAPGGANDPPLVW